jgi:hypothetical protein
MRSVAGEDAEDVVCLRERALVVRTLREIERLVRKMRRPRVLPAPMCRKTPIGPDPRSMGEVLGSTERGTVMTLGLIPLATAVMHVRELVLHRRSRRS